MSMHEAFMRAALEIAAKDENEVPVGAVVVHEGQIIASAHNHRESGEPFAHAEMLAMQQACQILGTRRLSGCTLYVTLEPCPMCAGAMVMAQLGACVYGAPDARQGCCGSVYDIPQDRHFYHHVRCYGGILHEECAALLKTFFESKRKPASTL